MAIEEKEIHVFDDIITNMREYEETAEDKLHYKDSTFEIISKVAYLIGVPKRIFEDERQSPKLDIFERLEIDKNARIIRHLCAVRTALERNYKQVNDRMKFEYRSFLTMPDRIPQESIKQLLDDGIDLYRGVKNHTYPSQHIVEINKLIADRINNCKGIFPLWINWNYIKDLFLMPNGTTEAGTKVAAATYYANIEYYPYRIYINWTPRERGNILASDKKFVQLLYELRGESFEDLSKVSDVGQYVRSGIYDFLDDGEKIIVIVDCENADPYKLCAAFRNLDLQYLQKIEKIILFDDINTASAWDILSQHISVPVEHEMIDRLKEDKSLVDIRLTARACQEHYANSTDSFLLISSDSDFWGLISSLKTARFLVMVEKDAISPKLKTAFMNAGIFYCYTDDFFSGNTEDLKKNAILREMYSYIEEHLDINIYEMFDEALTNTRASMTPAEKRQFIAQHVKPMQLRIDDDGRVTLELKP